MHVVGISGSMRKDGNTASLVQLVLKPVEEAGISSEYISLADKVIRPCTGCESCKREHSCSVMDDDWADIIGKVLECDVLVLGSPTYYYDIGGHLKNFIDRTYSLYHDRQLSGKSAVGVAVHADEGGERALQTLEGFFNSHGFSFLGNVLGKGYLPGDVLQDAAAVKSAGQVGKKIVRLLGRQD